MEFLFGVIRKVCALVAELVDAQDLKSCLPKGEYGSDSRLGHQCLSNKVGKAFSFGSGRVCPPKRTNVTGLATTLSLGSNTVAALARDSPATIVGAS